MTTSIAVPAIVQHKTFQTNPSNGPTVLTMPKPLTKGNYLLVMMSPGQPFFDLPADKTWPPANTFAGFPLLQKGTIFQPFVSEVPVFGGVITSPTLPNLPAEPWSGPNPNNGGTAFIIFEISGVTSFSFFDLFASQNEACTQTNFTLGNNYSTQPLVIVMIGWSNGYGSEISKITPTSVTTVEKTDPGPNQEAVWWVISSNTLPEGNVNIEILCPTATPIQSTDGSYGSLMCVLI